MTTVLFKSCPFHLVYGSFLINITKNYCGPGNLCHHYSIPTWTEENQIIYIRRKGKLVQASVGAGRNSNNVVAKIKPDFKKKKKSREIRGLIFLEEQGIFFLLKRLMKISYLSNVNLLFLSLTQYSSKETAYLLKNVCTHIFVSLTVSFNY